MNWDILAGAWKQYKGTAKVRWGRFSDEPLHVLDGKRLRSVGIAQRAKGIAKDKLKQKERTLV